MKFNDIIGKKIAVHCDTIEKSDKFLDECEKSGILWASGDAISEYWSHDKWLVYMGNTYYNIFEGDLRYSDGVFCLRKEYEVIEFDEIIFED